MTYEQVSEIILNLNPVVTSILIRSGVADGRELSDIPAPGERIVTVDRDGNPENGPYRIIKWDLDDSEALIVEDCGKSGVLPTRRYFHFEEIMEIEVLALPAPEDVQ